MQDDRKKLRHKPEEVVNIIKKNERNEKNWNEAVDGLRGNKLRAGGDTNLVQVSIGNFKDKVVGGKSQNSENRLSVRSVLETESEKRSKEKRTSMKALAAAKKTDRGIPLKKREDKTRVENFLEGKKGTEKRKKRI
ncbi:MAG: hypothetical protein LBI29_02305 [Rickettsiales bacterium]|jgi:hypothetical protein|nr:hypothetical protein [Rickettsiales bacterium]